MVLIIEALTPKFLERNFGILSLMGNIETKQQAVAVDADIHSFIDSLEIEPFDQNLLKKIWAEKRGCCGIIEASIWIKM